MLSSVGQRIAELRERRRTPERVVRLSSTGPRTIGSALVSYLREPVAWRSRDRRLAGHTNKWECREVVSILRSLGFAVDVVDFRDHAFEPQQRYDVVLALDGELSRLSALAQPSLRLLHLTGAYGRFQNAAELERLEDLYRRRGVRCEARRLVPDLESADRALAEADACSLIGNEWTLGTYPEADRGKLSTIPVTGTLPAPRRPADQLAPREREFLWFFGSGAVHKGLDRALEAFSELPRHTLRVIGNVDGEADFWEAYAAEAALPNVHLHGFLDPGSRPFREATQGCFCVLAPSCSEGTSPATVTMLQLGLLPLISRQTGVSLPAGAGHYLEECSVNEIQEAVVALAALPSSEVTRQAAAVQAFALDRYSRASFTTAMLAYLELAVTA